MQFMSVYECFLIAVNTQRSSKNNDPQITWKSRESQRKVHTEQGTVHSHQTADQGPERVLGRLPDDQSETTNNHS